MTEKPSPVFFSGKVYSISSGVIVLNTSEGSRGFRVPDSSAITEIRPGDHITIVDADGKLDRVIRIQKAVRA